MNATRPEISPQRPNSSLKTAGMGTVALHAVVLLLVWLWPRPPIKAKERLLVVNLTQQNTPVPTLEPTAKPTTKPTVRPTPVPTEKPLPTEKPAPTPTPKLAKETRVAKIHPPKPVPTAKKVEVVPTPLPEPFKAPQPKREETHPHGSLTAPKKVGLTGKAPSAPRAGGSKRRFALNDTPVSPDTHPEPSSSAKSGSNARGAKDETAGAIPGLNLPRTVSRRGRHGDLNAPSSSAPVRTNDGTEVNIGPSSPSSTSGGSRQHSVGAGSGEDDNGPLHSGGLPGATGFTTSSNAKMGRGADEAGGEGVSNGSHGDGARGHSGRGRGGSRIAGDPFGTDGDGNGKGKGKSSGPGEGDGPGNGLGNGPKNGTRLAKRDLGDGDGDDGPGRGGGAGLGDGSPGDGGTGTGLGSGRGDDSAESADGGRGRTRRVSASHRENDAEDQIGRGIWKGFHMRFYQDKADHPDELNLTDFKAGNDIDWPVFTHFVKEITSPNLDGNWNTDPPITGMKSTYWSMKATGKIFVPKDDTYVFSFDKLDDAGRLYLDGDRVINVWIVQMSSPTSGQMFLQKGMHDIQIDYVQGPAQEASIKLMWSSTSFAKEIVGVYKKPGEK